MLKKILWLSFLFTACSSEKSSGPLQAEATMPAATPTPAPLPQTESPAMSNPNVLPVRTPVSGFYQTQSRPYDSRDTSDGTIGIIYLTYSPFSCDDPNDNLTPDKDPFTQFKVYSTSAEDANGRVIVALPGNGNYSVNDSLPPKGQTTLTAAMSVYNTSPNDDNVFAGSGVVMISNFSSEKLTVKYNVTMSDQTQRSAELTIPYCAKTLIYTHHDDTTSKMVEQPSPRKKD